MSDKSLEKTSRTLDKELWEAYEKRAIYGRLRGAKETADDRLKIIYAQLWNDAPITLKTIPDKDAWVKDQEAYLEAVEEKADKHADWICAEARMKLLFALKEKYQTDAKMGFDMDKAHV